MIQAQAFRRSPDRQRALVVAVAVVWLVVLTSTGCAVKFIGDYDEAIDTGVSDVQQQAEVYFGKLKADPSTPYDPNFYNDVNARMVVLKTRAHILAQNQIIEQQLQELQGQFDRMQALDKSMARPFPMGAVDAAESALTISVESILRLELALKHGKAAPEASASAK